MGTSNAFGGQSGATPLVPNWLETNGTDSSVTGEPPSQSAIPSATEPTRFRAARNNFSRFARSGGNDIKSLGRAISHYVSSSSGGAHTAAVRMGSARIAGSRLLSFLSDTINHGASEALHALNLDALAGRPIEEIFTRLADTLLPEGGSIDEGIAREAFIETIADLAGAGITDLDGLTTDQMQTVFEFYVAHAIEARICNDIGAKTVTLPSDERSAAQVQAQLRDFIQRGVADALTSARTVIATLTPDRIFSFVESIYEQAFEILQVMGAAEAEAS